MEYNKSMYLKIIKNKFFYTLTCTRSYFTDCKLVFIIKAGIHNPFLYLRSSYTVLLLAEIES